MSALGHVWTAPPWQELSDLLQHWSGAVMCPACLCGGEAAGHNALRGSGPNQKHAFKDALTQAGSPDPRIDLVCITSSCPRQFLQNFKRRHRCLASPPLIALASTQTSLSHFDAAEWAPSTASEATVYRLLKDHGLITSPAFILMKAADRFANPTTAPNQLWQTDFTYLKVIGWGWFYLSTVLDDFSRYILAWKLCTTMSATDVSDTLQVALRGSGLNQVKLLHRPRLLSDNGPSYVSSELGKWLEDNGIRHIRGRPYHPMTQGKIERYHRSMKNRILLDNYYLPGQLEQSIEEFVSYYNNCRYHESLDNLTPADVYFGRGQVILERREKIKRKTIEQRRRLNQQAIAA